MHLAGVPCICHEREWCTQLSTCYSFQFSPKTRQTMPLYDYLTPKLDFKRKFNHGQSFLYKGRLAVRTIRQFRIGSSLPIESRIGSSIRNRIESRSFAGPYWQERSEPLAVSPGFSPLCRAVVRCHSQGAQRLGLRSRTKIWLTRIGAKGLYVKFKTNSMTPMFCQSLVTYLWELTRGPTSENGSENLLNRQQLGPILLKFVMPVAHYRSE